MHAPRPYGLAVYGSTLTDDDRHYIDNLAKKLTNLKGISRLDSLKLTHELPDGGQVMMYDMGGVFRAVAVKPSMIDDVPHTHDYMVHSHIPMMYSGVIVKSMVRADEGVAMQITDWTRRRLTNYHKEKKAPKQLELQRFVIDYHDRVQEFKPNPPPPQKHTQYTRQRPTWYSGSMAKVMQIVGGYGRQDFKELPQNDREQAKITLPDDIKQRIDNELNNKILPAYTGYPAISGQYQYDYKHRLTHGVGFDDVGGGWLLSMSAKGVYAMPLPVIPATTTPAYREWVESVGDTEILSILDTFGGLPSGESFPSNEQDFRAWERAGVIIKVCDMADFYSHLPYSTGCGWSLNTLGTDGYNTCYDYNDNGMVVGFTYNMTLSLKSVADGGRLPSNAKTLHDNQAEKLANYLSELTQKVDKNTAKGASIRYKLRRHTDKELYEKIGMSVDDWDNLTLPPIAKHTGQVRQVYQGLLYHPAPPNRQPQIKFPEPMLHGCVSFDFSILDGYDHPTTAPVCDTVMFAYYADDDLKVVKYYYNGQKFTQERESTFEDVMIVGNWYEITYGKTSGMMGNFYHSEIDDRQAVSDTMTRTDIVGNDMGYGNPAFTTPPVLWKWGSLSRARYYSYRTTVKSVSNFSLSVAICVPYFARNAVIYAYGDHSQSEYFGDKLERRSVADPRSYGIWTYDPIFHFRGKAGIGSPSPKTGDKVYVNYDPQEDYHYDKYSWFAESGDWYGVPEGSYKDVSWLAVYTDRKAAQKNIGGVVVGGEATQLATYERNSSKYGISTHRMYLSISDKIQLVHENVPDNWYFRQSPMMMGGGLSYFYRDVCKNLMGDTEYSNVSEQVDGKRKYWGNSQFINGVGHDTAHHFIGVISA